jgi:hypothetical protein
MTSTTFEELTTTQRLAAERLTAHEQAQEVQAERLVELQTVEEALYVIDGKWQTGDASPTSASRAKLDAELLKLKTLTLADERIVKKAESRLVNTDDRVAAILAPIIASVLPVAVTVETVTPAKAPETLPALVVVQLGETTTRYDSGSLSGKVELRYYRSALLAPLDAKAISKALDKAGIGAEVGGEYGSISTNEVDGVYEDFARAQVFAAYEMTPTVAAPGSSESVATFGRHLAGRLVDRYVINGPGGPQPSFRVDSDAGQATAPRIKDGRTHVTVTTTIHAKSSREAKAGIDQNMTDIVTSLVGSPIPGLGRCTSAGVTGAIDTTNAYGGYGGRAVTVEAVFVSTPVA